MLIRNARIVTPSAVTRGAVLITGTSITAVGSEISPPPAATVVEANDLFLLPGLIDVHVHVRDPGAPEKEDWLSATRAALAAGITTICDMPNNTLPTISPQRLYEKREIASHSALCDYALYLGATADNIGLAAQLASDIAGLKIYLASTTGPLLVDDWQTLFQHLRHTPSAIPITIHAEDEECLRTFASVSSHDHNANRPPLCAELALYHVITAARAAHRGVHIAHVSTPHEITILTKARASGIPITCEICPHHLYLTSDDAERLGGWGKVNPPLRSPSDVTALWRLLPYIDLFATDHAPHRPSEKAQPYPFAPSGFSGLETLLPLLLLAVQEGRLRLTDIATMAAFRPAQIFHMHRKGLIAPGYHADLCLVDITQQQCIQPGTLHTKPNDTPFRNWFLPGKVLNVWRRGEQVVSNGHITATPGSGRPLRFHRP